MNIVVQVAGKARPGSADQLKAHFRAGEAVLKAQPGFVRADALVNQNTLQVQILFVFDGVDAAMAFTKGGAMGKVMEPFRKLVEPATTLVLSVLEDSITA